MSEKETREQYEDEIDLFELIHKILRKWKMIAGITFGITLIAAIIAFVLPEQYMAQATYEYSAFVNHKLPMQEYIGFIKKYKKNIYWHDFNVTTIQNKEYVTFGAYGKSQQEAINHLEKLTNIILKEAFKDKIADTKIKLEKNIQSINETISLYKSITNAIVDPASINNLIYQKNLIMLWLQKPYILKQVGSIEVTPKPVKPRKLLIIAIAFISGLFISLFIVLFVDAYDSWKNSRKENV